MSTLEERIRERERIAQQGSVGTSIIATRGANPQTAARANRIARREGLPASTVERELPDVEARIRARANIEVARQAPPRAQGWFADPRNASAAGDDLPRLVGMAQAMDQAVAARAARQSRRAGNADGFWDRLAAKGAGGLDAVDAGLMRVGAALQDWTSDIELPWLSDEANARNRAASQAKARGLQRRADLLTSTAPVRGATSWQQVKARPTPGNVASFVAEEGVASLPGMVVAGLAPWMYVASQAGDIGKRRAENNGREQAEMGDVVKAAPAAVASMLLERSGIAGIISSTGRNAAVRIGKAGAREALTEFGQGIIENAGGSVGTDRGFDLAEALDEGFAGAVAGAGVGAGGRSVVEGGQATVQRIERRRALRVIAGAIETQGAGAVVDQIMDGARQTTLRENDPEGFREYVARVSEGTPVENVYIPAEAIRELFQDGSYADDPLFGQHVEQIEEALATDGEVVIPLADVATMLAGKPEWSKLRERARFTPGGYSEADLKGIEETFKAQMGERVAAADEAAQAEASPTQQVFEDVYNRLLAIGRTPRQASRDATIIATQTEMRAARRGMDALAYHQQRGLVARDGNGAGAAVPQGRALDASGPFDQTAAREAARAKKVHLDAHEQDGVIHLNAVERLKGARKGSGAKAVRALLDEADRVGLPVVLRASGTRKSKRDDPAKLIDYYRQFGFEQVEEGGTEMRREPRGTFDRPDDARVMFQRGARGRISGGMISGTDDPTVIDVFKSDDPSTVMHEFGHLMLEELRRDARLPNAPQSTREEWAAISDWFAQNGYAFGDRDIIPTGAHELFARGWERYLMEGKAPVPALQRVLSAFRDALVKLYRTVVALNSPITPEVRRVFDLMLATHDEIEAARDQQGSEARFENAAQAGMSEAEFADYRRLADQARDTAFDDALNRAMATVRKQRTLTHRRERERLRDEVTERVNAMPVFRALHLLRTGRFLDDPDREPMRLKIDRAWIVDRYGAEALDEIEPKGGVSMLSDKGDDPEIVANMAGFATADEMVTALRDAERERRSNKEGGDNRSLRTATIEDEVNALMDERHGNLMNDEGVEEEALALVNNATEGEVIAAEVRALAKRAGEQPTPLSMVREWARRKIAQGRVVDVASRAAIQRYARAQARAARAFEAALMEGNVDEAFRQSEIRLLNHALIVEARKAADRIDVIVPRLGKIAKTATRKTIEQGYLDRAHALLDKFEFGTTSQRALDEIESFGAWAEKQKALGVDVAVPPRLEADGTHYTRMTVEELSDLDESVKQLLHLGRFKQKLLDEKERRDFYEVRDEMVATARHNVPPRKPEPNIESGLSRKLKLIAGAHAGLTKMGRMIDVLDGGKVTGPFNRHIWRPLADAHHRFNDIMRDVQQQMMDSLKAVDRKVFKTFADKVVLSNMPGAGGDTTWTRMQMHQMARNAGNPSNWQVLCEGRGWDADAAFADLDAAMTREEWEYVQRDLDLVGSFWPEIASLYRRVNGIEPPRIEAAPIVTRHGTFRGGYYPLVPDHTANPKLERALRSDELFNAMFTRATTRNGFVNERTGAIYVVSLEAGASQRHITEVVHDFTHREPIMQADKFLSDPAVIEAMRQTIGPEMEGQFRPWLKHIANQWASDTTGNQAVEKIANSMRTSMSIMGMGFRLSTMFTQLAGYFNSIEMLGTDGEKWMLSGFRSVAGMTEKTARQFAVERSGVVRHRFQSVDRTQEQELARLEGKHGFAAEVRRFAFLGIGIMDHLVIVPTWHAGYNKAIAEGMDEDDAIAFADKVVEGSQGGGAAMNSSAIQRQRGMASLLAMFYSYASAYYNRQAQLARDIRGARRARDVPRLLARSFWLLFAPSLGTAMLSAFLNGGPDDDEDESWASYLMGNVVGGLFMGLPVVGGAIKSAITGFDFQASPLDRAGTVLGRGLRDAWFMLDDELGFDPDEETEPSRTAVKNATEAVGYASALPLGQFSNAAQFTVDWANGEVDPNGVSDWLTGLQRGKLEE